MQTKASETVISEVLEKGNEYQDDNTDVLGVRYVCDYIPVYQTGTEEIVGMLFIGKCYDEVHAIVHNTKMYTGMVTLFNMIVIALIVYAIAYKLVKNISQGISYVMQIEEEHLGFSMDDKLLTRKDIVGDLCRSIKELEKRLYSIVEGVLNQCDILKETTNFSSRQTEDAIASVMQIDQTIQDIASDL